MVPRAKYTRAHVLSGDGSFDVRGMVLYLRAYSVAISRTETHFINAKDTRRRVKWLATDFRSGLYRLLEAHLLSMQLTAVIALSGQRTTAIVAV